MKKIKLEVDKLGIEDIEQIKKILKKEDEFGDPNEEDPWWTGNAVYPLLDGKVITAELEDMLIGDLENSPLYDGGYGWMHSVSSITDTLYIHQTFYDEEYAKHNPQYSWLVVAPIGHAFIPIEERRWHKIPEKDYKKGVKEGWSEKD